MDLALQVSVIFPRETTVLSHHPPLLSTSINVVTKYFLPCSTRSPLVHVKFQFEVCRSRQNRKLRAFGKHLSTIRSDGGELVVTDPATPAVKAISSSDGLPSLLSSSDVSDNKMTDLQDEMEGLDSSVPLNHRSGYVAVLGKPNVGKSTLSNQMIGQKLSIVTEKPQTTRHRILGLCSESDYQMILYDTPGVIEKKMHKLDSMMMKNVRSAAFNADCVLVVVDASKVPDKINEMLEEGLGSLKVALPTLLVLNKKDLVKPGEIAKKLEWYEKFTDVDDVIPVSAKLGDGVVDVKNWILSQLPFGPAFYPKDIASEHPERFFVAEIVREKIMMQYRNEVPYACQVNVVEYKSRPAAKDFIRVEVVVERNSQKMILIGKAGKALKLLATAARLDMEDFLQKKVYLEIEVKVKENWRQDEGLLKNYGYGAQI